MTITTLRDRAGKAVGRIMRHPQAQGSAVVLDMKSHHQFKIAGIQQQASRRRRISEARWADDHKLRVQQCQPEGAKSRVVP
jgi:hypothetical protein